MSGAGEDKVRVAVADWLRANEEVIKDRMRRSWRDSNIIQHEDFDALVMATVIEAAEAVRRG